MQNIVTKTLRKCYPCVKYTCYEHYPLTIHLQYSGPFGGTCICLVLAKNLSSHKILLPDSALYRTGRI